VASIQILLLSGPQQGKRLELSGEEFLFGRQPDCDIPIAGEFVSREHGMIACIDGQWIVQNASPNGTQVNRKKVGRKGFKLITQDIVQVGGEDVFQIIIPQVATALAPTEMPTDAPHRKSSRRTKLWIGIGSYLVLMMFMFVYLSTLHKTEEDQIIKPDELTRTMIEAIIRKPVTVETPDPRAAAQLLREAEELFNRQDAAVSGTYRVYHAYQLSLAHSKKTYFDDGLHQLRFDQVQKQLIDEVSRRYNEAFERLRSREYRVAEKQFRKLNDYYPDTTSKLFENCEKQRSYILKMMRKYKR
jgi:hypothetical protein